MAQQKLAVVLFNLGGPDTPAAVRPFLYNLFSDRAIIRAPWPVRQLLAWMITRKRAPAAEANYAILGGKSPLLELTQDQARAIENDLAAEYDAKCFVAMRYWPPRAHEVVRVVRAWAPDKVILFPLYPQYSTTTTGSSLQEWRNLSVRAGLVAETRTICCWHSDPAFIAASADIIRTAYDAARGQTAAPLRLLFSAHGLPEDIVKDGDPYQWQIEQTVSALVQALQVDGLDHRICYQSRVTPQVWIGPSTEEAIAEAGGDGRAVLIAPIAFVSEHSETLVELDVEYRHYAQQHNVPGYFRVPAQNRDPAFIAALAALIRKTAASESGLCSFAGARQCPKNQGDCPHAHAA